MFFCLCIGPTLTKCRQSISISFTTSFINRVRAGIKKIPHIVSCNNKKTHLKRCQTLQATSWFIIFPFIISIIKTSLVIFNWLYLFMDTVTYIQRYLLQHYFLCQSWIQISSTFSSWNLTFDICWHCVSTKRGILSDLDCLFHFTSCSVLDKNSLRITHRAQPYACQKAFAVSVALITRLSVWW